MRSRLLLVVLAALAWGGCDTSDLSDAEQIVGTWEPVSLNAVIGGALPVPIATLNQGQSAGTLVIESSGFIDLDITLGGKVVIPNTDVTVNLPADLDLSGTYTLDDAANTLTVRRGTRTTTLRYDLTPFLGTVESLQFVAESPDELVGLLGVSQEDAEAFFAVASGASIRFQRSVRTS